MHELPRSLQDLDQTALFPQIEITEQFVFQHEHLLLGLNYALFKSTHSDRILVDADLIAALAASAARYETLVHAGLHYQMPLSHIGQQAIATELENMVKEFREAEVKHAGSSRLRDSEVLHALIFLVRVAHSRTSGRPKSRAFVDFLSDQFPEKQSSIASLDPAANRIIVP